MIPTYLKPDCGQVSCHGACAHATKADPATGRWFITMGHAGFNTPANNRDGYKSQAAAKAAYLRCLNAGRASRGEPLVGKGEV